MTASARRHDSCHTEGKPSLAFLTFVLLNISPGTGVHAPVAVRPPSRTSIANFPASGFYLHLTKPTPRLRPHASWMPGWVCSKSHSGSDTRKWTQAKSYRPEPGPCAPSLPQETYLLSYRHSSYPPWSQGSPRPWSSANFVMREGRPTKPRVMLWACVLAQAQGRSVHGNSEEQCSAQRCWPKQLTVTWSSRSPASALNPGLWLAPGNPAGDHVSYSCSESP